MNVEDSYEGAAQRLRRLGYAGVDLAPPPPQRFQESDDDDRMRDLEELATLACDENEQLKQELGGARGEITRLQRLVVTLQEMVACAQSDDEPLTAPEETERLTQQLGGAYGEIERLQRLVVTLQEMVASAQSDDEPLTVPKSSGRGLTFFAIAIAGAAALLLMLHPWEPRQIAAVTAAAAVVAAPPPSIPKVEPKVEPAIAKIEPAIAKVEPTVPKVQPTVPKVQPTVPKVAMAPTRTKAQRRHAAKHASAKREKKRATAARSTNKFESSGTDPLDGLNL